MNPQSPCVECSRGEEDKNACSSVCQRLFTYQLGRDWKHLPLPAIEEKKPEKADAPICKRCGEHPANLKKDGSPASGLCVHCTSKSTNRKKEEKKQMSKTCEVDGCDKPVKARGKCASHYNAWRKGRLPGFPPFKMIQPLKGKRKDKKSSKQQPKGRHLATMPESQLSVDLNRYPEIRGAVYALAEKFFVTPEHVLIGLAGEALAAKAAKARA